MATRQISPTYQTTRTSGKKGGGMIGAGILGAIGGIAGGIGGFVGGGPAGAVGGSIAGAAGGASLGQGLGNAISPRKEGVETSTANPQVPQSAFKMAQDSQVLLDGLRAVQDHPSLASEYAESLTKAYVGSMVRLKQRG